MKETVRFTLLPTKDGCSLTLTSPDLKQENPFDILQSKSFLSAGKSSSCFESVWTRNFPLTNVRNSSASSFELP